MNSLTAFARLKRLQVPVFRTMDAATLLALKLDAASKTLMRLSRSRLVVKLRRGLWAFEEADPYAIAQYLTAPHPCYLSLQTALHHHGLLSQIPHVIYAVTTARPGVVKTPLGTFSFHHINADFFYGFQPEGAQGIPMAFPEKALLDIFYLSPAKSKLFACLPELDLSANFRKKVLRQLVHRMRTGKRKTLVLKKIRKYL